MMSGNTESDRVLPSDWLLHKHPGRFVEFENWLRAMEFSKIVGIYEINQAIYHFLHQSQGTAEDEESLRKQIHQYILELRGALSNARRSLAPLMSTVYMEDHFAWEDPEALVEGVLLDLLSPEHRSKAVLEKLPGICDIWKKLRVPFNHIKMTQLWRGVPAEPVYWRIAELVFKLDREIYHTIDLDKPTLELLLHIM